MKQVEDKFEINLNRENQDQFPCLSQEMNVNKANQKKEHKLLSLKNQETQELLKQQVQNQWDIYQNIQTQKITNTNNENQKLNLKQEEIQNNQEKKKQKKRKKKKKQQENQEQSLNCGYQFQEDQQDFPILSQQDNIQKTNNLQKQILNIKNVDDKNQQNSPGQNKSNNDIFQNENINNKDQNLSSDQKKRKKLQLPKENDYCFNIDLSLQQIDQNNRVFNSQFFKEQYSQCQIKQKGKQNKMLQKPQSINIQNQKQTSKEEQKKDGSINSKQNINNIDTQEIKKGQTVQQIKKQQEKELKKQRDLKIQQNLEQFKIRETNFTYKIKEIKNKKKKQIIQNKQKEQNQEKEEGIQSDGYYDIKVEDMDQDKLALFNQILKKLEEDHFKKYQKTEIDMENINIEKDYDLNTISYDQLKQMQKKLVNKQKYDKINEQKQQNQWDEEIEISLQSIKQKEKLKKFIYNLKQQINQIERYVKSQIQQQEEEIKLIKERQQEKRKFRQQLKNKRKLDSVVRIAKEVYKYRKEKQLPKPQKSKKKYKAVPANTLEFEVEERKKHKKSKVKEALQKYQQIQQKYYLEDEALSEKQKQQNQENLNQLNQQQLSNQEQINSNYETVAEMTENEQHIIKVHKNFYFSEKNYLKGQKYNGMELQGWVNHEPCQELDQKIIQFVNQLAYKQAMKKLKEPKKFKKRIVAGFNEVQKSLALNLNEFKSKLVILALNNKETPIEGGTNEYIAKILEKCQQKNIPVIHASSRARLGHAFRGKFGVRISCLSVINFQSLEELHSEIIEIFQRQRKIFLDKNFQNL